MGPKGLRGGVIECHESVTIVHTTRMRVSRIRDNRPLSASGQSSTTCDSVAPPGSNLSSEHGVASDPGGVQLVLHSLVVVVIVISSCSL